jgi:hypothetical protein
LPEKDQSTVGFGGGEEGFVGKEEFVRRQQRPAFVALQQVVARARVVPEGGDGGRRVAVGDEDGIFRQVVEKLAISSKNSGR